MDARSYHDRRRRPPAQWIHLEACMGNWSTFTYPLDVTTGDGRRYRALALGGDDQLLLSDVDTGALSRHALEDATVNWPDDTAAPDEPGLRQDIGASPVAAGT